MSKTKLYRRAYIGGTFDCLHRGHLALLAAVRNVAVETVVSVNTDEFTTRYKRKPLMSLADRIAVLEACRLVDEVVVNVGDEDSKIAIVAANVDCVVHGDDWTGPSLMEQMGMDAVWVASAGIDMVVLPYTKGVSTTSILQEHEQVAKEKLVPTLDPETAQCKGCNRVVMVVHVDEEGNCGDCTRLAGHVPTEADWADLGRPAEAEA